MANLEYMELPIYRFGKVVAYAKVDPDDWHKVNHIRILGKKKRIKWYLHPRGYAARRERRCENPLGHRGTVLLHRFILGLEKGDPLVGDHISKNGDYDPLDCRKSNLRAIEKKLNSFAFIQKQEQRAVKNNSLVAMMEA